MTEIITNKNPNRCSIMVFFSAKGGFSTKKYYDE
jgi:hypothetical protein